MNISAERPPWRLTRITALTSFVLIVIGAAIIEIVFNGVIGWCARLLIDGIRSEYSLPALGALCFTGVSTWAFHRDRSSRKRTAQLAADAAAYEIRIKELEKRLSADPPDSGKKAEKFERFEEIAHEGIRWAFVDFWPTAFFEQWPGSIRGIGLDLFNEVFDGIPTHLADEIVTWDNMLEKLEGGAFDVLVTPLYETRDRKNVSFCLPLFYSDIGVFVRDDDPLILTSAAGAMSYHKLLKWGEQFGSELQIEYIAGELHDHLCRKVFKNVTAREASPGCSPGRLLARLRDKNYTSHRLQFIERWQGERAGSEEKLRNLLLPAELLFPVSFVVRSTDDTLRRFINLRLLQIGDEKEGQGIYDLLLASSNALKLFDGVPEKDKLNRIADCFRRTVPRKISPETLKTEPRMLEFRGPLNQ